MFKGICLVKYNNIYLPDIRPENLNIRYLAGYPAKPYSTHPPEIFKNSHPFTLGCCNSFIYKIERCKFNILILVYWRKIYMFKSQHVKPTIYLNQNFLFISLQNNAFDNPSAKFFFPILNHAQFLFILGLVF